MNCSECKECLDSLGSKTLPADVREHADSCADCRRAVSVHETFNRGIAVLQKVPVPDLASRIVQKASHQAPETGEKPSLLRRLADFLSLSNPRHAMVFYGAAGFLIFILCQAILLRVPKRVPTAGPEQLQGWTCSLIGGNPADLPGVSAEPGKPIQIPDAKPLKLKTTGTFRLARGGVTVSTCELEGSFQEGRLDLGAGRADVEVEPRTPPISFRVTVPRGEVLVTGTVFSVEFRAGVLEVRVLRGGVQVTWEGRMLKLVPGGVFRSDQPVTPSATPGTSSTTVTTPGDSFNRPEGPD